MASKRGVSDLRRIVKATTRSESQPYDYDPGIRQPRLSGSGGGNILYCVPSAGIVGAGLPPSGTVHSLAGQTVYSLASGVWAVVASGVEIWNPYAAAVVASKLCAVIPDAGGGFRVVAQSCTQMGLTAQDVGCCCAGGGFGTCPGHPDPGYCCCPDVGFPLPETLYLTVCGQTFTMAGGCGWGAAPGNITTPVGVAVVTGAPTCGWNGVSTGAGTVVLGEISILCPTNTTTATMTIGTGVLVNTGTGTYALCPIACSNGIGGGLGVLTLTGTITPTSVSLSGTMPATFTNGAICPCAGQAVVVTD